MQERLSRDPFSALGLIPSATPADIRNAFLARTKEFHPARFARMSPEIQRLANEVFLQLRAAHDTIARPTTVPRTMTPGPMRPGTSGIPHRPSGTGANPTVRPATGTTPLASSSSSMPPAGGRPGTSPTPAVRPGSNPAPTRPGAVPGQPYGGGPTQPLRGTHPTDGSATQPLRTTHNDHAVTQPLRTDHVATQPIRTDGRTPAPPGKRPTPPAGIPARPGVAPSTAPPIAGPPRRPTPSGAAPISPAVGGLPRPAGPPVDRELAAIHELIAQQQLAAARAALETLCTRQPQNLKYRALLCFARGREAQLAQRIDEARVELQDALQLDPDLQLAKSALAELFTRRR